MRLPLHGSNPQYLYKYFNMEMPKGLIDFSTNINPLGPPNILKEKWVSWFDCIDDYPDPDGADLTKQIAMRENVGQENVLLGNGGAQLIGLVACLFTGKHVLLIQPTFSEYEQMCRSFNCTISHYQLQAGDWELDLEEFNKKLPDVDVVFFCHPNNPTGKTYPVSQLTEMVVICEQNDCYLVIDEAFVDFMPEPFTMVPFIAEHPHLIVLRSLTKMYAIAGLRLGYVIAAPAIIGSLKSRMPHWSVNALALTAGIECIGLDGFSNRTRKFITKERDKMVRVLRHLGYQVSDSFVNYYLLRDARFDEQYALIRFLLGQGLVPRHTVNYRGLNGRWLRFAVKDEPANERLLEALKLWKNRDSFSLPVE